MTIETLQFGTLTLLFAAGAGAMAWQWWRNALTPKRVPVRKPPRYPAR